MNSVMKGKAAVEKLKNWIASAPTIPVRNGKVNRTAICQILSISRSTIGSNSELRIIFEHLDAIHTINCKGNSNLNEEDTIIKLESLLEQISLENDLLRKDLLLQDIFFSTGRWLYE